MKIEFLLSIMNLKLSDLDKMNIKCSCIVINQCDKVGYQEYKNFKIYNTDDLGVSNSRNMAISKSNADILVFVDNDCVYNDDALEKIISFYEIHKNADMVLFNFDKYDKDIKITRKDGMIGWYNYQRYAAYRITFKRQSIIKNNIKLNVLFGGNSKYSHGEDTIFIREALKNNLKMYASKDFIGKIIKNDYKSTWFNGYTKKFFFDKGALFSVLSPRFKYLQCIQYLLRHRDVWQHYHFNEVLTIMFNGVAAYKENLSYEDVYGNV